MGSIPHKYVVAVTSFSVINNHIQPIQLQFLKSVEQGADSHFRKFNWCRIDKMKSIRKRHQLNS